MATLTKLSKPLADYHQWDSTEFTNGDILDIEASLGRAARIVTLESITGASGVRFNVVGKVFKSQAAAGNTFIQDAAFWRSPILAGEVEDTNKDVIDIAAGDVQTWTGILVRDIKIVTSSGLRITVE